MEAAAEIVREKWPLEQPVPPQLLWKNTVAYAAQIAIAALMFGKTTEPDTQSWTEVPFGNADLTNLARPLPWNPTLAVAVPGTDIRIRDDRQARSKAREERRTRHGLQDRDLSAETGADRYPRRRGFAAFALRSGLPAAFARLCAYRGAASVSFGCAARG